MRYTNRRTLYFTLHNIRPILEYCSVMWHHGPTKAQIEQLQAVQRRAVRIIIAITVNTPYQFAMAYANISKVIRKVRHHALQHRYRIVTIDYCDVTSPYL